VDWEFGCAHEDPEDVSLCDDCWCRKHRLDRID
jgi:hypothetical protein